MHVLAWIKFRSDQIYGQSCNSLTACASFVVTIMKSLNEDDPKTLNAFQVHPANV